VRVGGFTLVEVLVALVVLAVGMLGMALLLHAGLQGSRTALEHAQAVNLAADMAERMRANRSAVAAYDTSDGTPDPRLDAACEDAAGPCTPDAMAGNDLRRWLDAVAPRSRGTGRGRGRGRRGGRASRHSHGSLGTDGDRNARDLHADGGTVIAGAHGSSPARLLARQRHRRGVSLVELLVAMTLGLGLLGAALTVYLKARDVHTTLETTARLQEVAQYALGLIESDVRMGGYLGLTSRRRW